MENSVNMTNEREGKILEGAIAKFGTQAQIAKAVEELNELAAELARHLNGQAKVENIREEMADAFIMLNQMEMIFGDVSDVEIRKLERLEGMVAEG